MSVSVEMVCVSLVVSVELLVLAVNLLGGLLSCPVTSSSQLSIKSSQLRDVHGHLVQIVKQLTRDIDIFWQVNIHTMRLNCYFCYFIKTKFLKTYEFEQNIGRVLSQNLTNLDRSRSIRVECSVFIIKSDLLRRI